MAGTFPVEGPVTMPQNIRDVLQPKPKPQQHDAAYQLITAV